MLTTGLLVGIIDILVCGCVTAANDVKASPVFKQKPERDQGFQPSTEFAQILSVSYKQAVNATEATERHGGAAPVRKFDSGNEPTTEEPSVFNLFTSANASRLWNPNGRTNKPSKDRSTKAQRGHYGAASSYLHGRFHPAEDANGHGKLYFPESANEVSSHHQSYSDHHHHDDSYRHHGHHHNDDSYRHHGHHHNDDSYYHHGHHYSVSPHSPKHTDGYYAPVSTSSPQLHDSGLKEAVSKSLKFWIPTALFITGASVLFPTRVKVPTNPSDLDYLRPKRSTRHYSFTAGDAQMFERILPQNLPQGNPAHQPVHRETESETTSSSSSLRRVPVRAANRNRTIAQPAQNVNQNENVDALSGFESKYDTVGFSKQIAVIPRPEITGGVVSTQSSLSPAEPPKSRKGRKIRVLLRARKYPTVQAQTQESKAKTDSKPNKAVKPTTEESTSVSTPAEIHVTSAIAASTQRETYDSSSATEFRRLPKLSQPQPETLQLLGDTGLAPSAISAANENLYTALKQYDLSPGGPVVGLLSSVVDQKNDSEACQKRALCEIAIRGVNPGATRFETFLWSLATLVPDAFTTFYDLEDTFAAIRDKQCARFRCANPNLDIQEIPEFHR